jgi:hypothetical protein
MKRASLGLVSLHLEPARQFAEELRQVMRSCHLVRSVQCDHEHTIRDCDGWKSIPLQLHGKLPYSPGHVLCHSLISYASSLVLCRSQQTAPI